MGLLHDLVVLLLVCAVMAALGVVDDEVVVKGIRKKLP